MEILELIRNNPEITYDEISARLGKARSGIAKHIKKLQEQGLIRRDGHDYGGRWEIIENIRRFLD
jgi:ATP-dependent DNA helicase RecG